MRAIAPLCRPAALDHLPLPDFYCNELGSNPREKLWAIATGQEVSVQRISTLQQRRIAALWHIADEWTRGVCVGKSLLLHRWGSALFPLTNRPTDQAVRHTARSFERIALCHIDRDGELKHDRVGFNDEVGTWKKRKSKSRAALPSHGLRVSTLPQPRCWPGAKLPTRRLIPPCALPHQAPDSQSH